MCSSIEYPYLPHREIFFIRPPPPLEIPIYYSNSIHYLINFLVFETLPQEFPILCVGEYGYFQEIHNSNLILTTIKVIEDMMA